MCAFLLIYFRQKMGHDNVVARHTYQNASYPSDIKSVILGHDIGPYTG